jgi:hypothetical protein
MLEMLDGEDVCDDGEVDDMISTMIMTTIFFLSAVSPIVSITMFIQPGDIENTRLLATTARIIMTTMRFELVLVVFERHF